MIIASWSHWAFSCVSNVGEGWSDAKLHDLMSAGRDLEVAFDHTAANLRDLADKYEAEQVVPLRCCLSLGHSVFHWDQCLRPS